MENEFFTEEERRHIVQAIHRAEMTTSGEIRVHIEKHCQKEDVLDRAAEVFATLNMHKTRLRNGVLFYLAVEDHRFAIIGDAGINQVVPDHYWGDVKDHMKERFVAGQLSLGLCEGIQMAGLQLKEHFPYMPNDKNELPDEISFGKN